MRVFLTSGTGYLGSAISAQLIARGHAVSGLARSGRSAAVLSGAGVTPLRGDLADLDLLRTAVRDADGVVHAGFSHDDWGRMDEAFAQDERAVEAMLDELAGSDKPFVYTSGSGVLADMGPQEAGEDAALSEDPSVARRIAIKRRVLGSSARGMVS